MRRRFYLPSADYVWPHVMNARLHEVVTANGGEIVGEEYFPLDHMDYRGTAERIVASGADAVFNTIVPPGVTPFFGAAARRRVLARDGGHLICTYFDENFLNLSPRSAFEGLYGCLDYYQAIEDPFSRKQNRGGVYRRCCVHGRRRVLRAVPRPTTLGRRGGRGGHDAGQDDVIAALDHAELAEGPGGRRPWRRAGTTSG